MATSLDRQLNRIEKADAAARKIHSIFLGLGETNEEARARYESERGPIAEGDLVVLIQTGLPDEGEAAAAKPKIVAVQRKRVKPPAPGKPKPREWGGTTCPQPPPAHADEKRDPYRSDWKKPLRYADIYPDPAGGMDENRALRAYAQKLSRRSSL